MRSQAVRYSNYSILGRIAIGTGLGLAALVGAIGIGYGIAHLPERTSDRDQQTSGYVSNLRRFVDACGKATNEDSDYLLTQIAKWNGFGDWRDTKPGTYIIPKKCERFQE